VAYQLGEVDSSHGESFIEPREREPRSGFRPVIATAAAFLVMGAFGGGLWFAYHQGVRHGSVVSSSDVPLIRADERPTKVKPENAGGMEVPDRDKLIYTQKRAAVEHLLPLPEKPMPRPTASAPAPSAAAISPAPAAPGAPSATAASASPAQPQGSAGKPAPKNKAAPVLPEKASPAHPVQAQTGTARIQLGSVRSEQAAQHEWERLKHANADLLASLSATPTRADLGEKGVFYRIQTGPITDADRICGELKRRNIGCVIAR
jgi:SPOR domain